MRWISMACCVVLFTAGCVQFPADDDDPGPSLDFGTTTQLDGEVPLTSLIRQSPDAQLGGAPGSTLTPLGSKQWPPNNSGAVCDTSLPCPNAGVEDCLNLTGSSGKGMCLGKCTSVGSSCPTASAAQLSICAASDPTRSTSYCVYFCLLQGQSYTCPDPTKQQCAAVDPTDPSIKVCMPM